MPLQQLLLACTSPQLPPPLQEQLLDSIYLLLCFALRLAQPAAQPQPQPQPQPSLPEAPVPSEDAPAGTPLPADYDGVATFGFHQDSGVQRDIRGQQPWISSDQSHPIAPRMSLKAAFYLTDCSTPGCGNTWVVRPA